MPVWNEIVQRNAAKVLNAALRVLGNLADAEDVSQEVGSLYRGFSKVESCAGTAMEGILRRWLFLSQGTNCRRRVSGFEFWIPKLRHPTNEVT